LLGYLWAKAETEINLKPLAVAGEKSKRGGKKGGIESGKARRKKADEGWIAIAKRMALAIRIENKNLSQDKVAEEISSSWKDDKILPQDIPGSSS
jgi:hypothetical protein